MRTLVRRSARTCRTPCGSSMWKTSAAFMLASTPRPKTALSHLEHRGLSPFERPYVLASRRWLRACAMTEAPRCSKVSTISQRFQAAGTIMRTTDRISFSSRLIAETDPDRRAALLVYEVRGEGFLGHMVRSIAGTLVEIGKRRYTASRMREVLESRSRALAGPTAPAAGLFLVRVEYQTPDL